MKKLLVVAVILFLPSAALLLFKRSIPVTPEPMVIAVPSPAGSGSRLPRLNLSDKGAVRLSWVEPSSSGADSLRFSRLTKQGWEPPREIARGDDWFVNWADFPSLSAASEQLLAAHWLERGGQGAYAYGVRLSLSKDGGRTWSDSLAPHSDGLPVEHGFVSLQPWRHEFALVWLDGRETGAHGEGAMGLRFTTFDGVGTGDESVLDNRVCDCCQTAMARIPNGLLVVYRDRSEDETRDISAVRWLDGAWSAPMPVHNDGWRIAGCPVNGPALATQGDNAAVAWYTEADDKPRVQVALSQDSGGSFSGPIRVDGGKALGRVDLAFTRDGALVVSWLEEVDKKTARFQIRRLEPDSRRSDPVVVAEGDFSRLAGFPQMLVRGDDVVLAWTAVEDGSTSVQTALVRLASLQPAAESDK